MNRKTVYFLAGVTAALVVFFIVAVIGLLAIRQFTTPTNTVANTETNSTELVTNDTLANTTDSTDDTVDETPTPVETTTFENDYMKFSYPSTWTIAESTPSAINIVKGHYILFINTQASQASGVPGGRFAEISMGAPGADLIIKSQPGNPCGTNEKSDAFTGYQTQTRNDLYISSAEVSENCNLPTNGKDLWYFSYVTNDKNQYFNYYVEGQAKAYVITMTYNTSDINNLPVKGSTELDKMLTEMTDIVKTLEINSSTL